MTESMEIVCTAAAPVPIRFGGFDEFGRGTVRSGKWTYVGAIGAEHDRLAIRLCYADGVMHHISRTSLTLHHVMLADSIRKAIREGLASARMYCGSTTGMNFTRDDFVRLFMCSLLKRRIYRCESIPTEGYLRGADDLHVILVVENAAQLNDFLGDGWERVEEMKGQGGGAEVAFVTGAEEAAGRTTARRAANGTQRRRAKLGKDAPASATDVHPPSRMYITYNVQSAILKTSFSKTVDSILPATSAMHTVIPPNTALANPDLSPLEVIQQTAPIPQELLVPSVFLNHSFQTGFTKKQLLLVQWVPFPQKFVYSKNGI